MEEYWDIYDENRQLTGRKMLMNDWHMEPGEYHMSVTCAVRDAQGRYLIQQRAADKEWGAGWWELPGGGVLAGETIDEAVIREVGEETGLDVSDADTELVFYYKRDNAEARNNYFMNIYRVDLDFKPEDVTVQVEEVDGFKLATVDEIREIAARGEFLHYDSIKQLFE